MTSFVLVLWLAGIDLLAEEWVPHAALTNVGVFFDGAACKRELDRVVAATNGRANGICLRLGNDK